MASDAGYGDVTVEKKIQMKLIPPETFPPLNPAEFETI